LSALQSTGKYSCDAWNLDDPAGNEDGSFCSMSLLRILKYSFFVSDTFIGVLQPFITPHFMFISMKILFLIHKKTCFSPLPALLK
jgi:hypothetical protein